MGLFILRLAEEGPALSDGRIHVGDQIVEINGEATQGITHTRAIELIQAGGSKVLLLLRAGGGAVPDHSSKDKVAAPLRLSEGPSSSSLSTSEISPSSPKTSEENRSRSHSPRKTEREHSGSLEDMRKDVRKDMRKGQRDHHHHHSSSPRKTSKNQEEPQREKNPGIGKSDGDGTLGRRRTKEKEEKEKEEVKKEKEKEEVKKDPRGSSSSSINDPGCNGINKKTPTISPGPWKVPSSSKVHNQESSYADI
ncbi:membrane-associated guanylate kinase, WW and PDZ domain-containing protein 3-like [Trematomus bernacchii]|nr:membrane-associated guanylate kinase, WW and PDZ domain-containing protein 3-like [Trematomus bernacchii]